MAMESTLSIWLKPRVNRRNTEVEAFDRLAALEVVAHRSIESVYVLVVVYQWTINLAKGVSVLALGELKTAYSSHKLPTWELDNVADLRSQLRPLAPALQRYAL